VHPQSEIAEPASDVARLQRLYSGRFTCRAYRPEAVPENVISSILDIAKQTASWCNVQPWHVTITGCESTDAFRAALIEHATQASGVVDSDLPFPKEYRGIYAERRREAGYKLYEALGIGRGDMDRRASQSFENYKLFGAPHVAIVTTPADLGPYAAVDCGAFIGSFLLAAYAHGVATTPQAALARHAKFIRSYFGLGDERHMVCGISFGYADLDHPVNRFRTSRAPHDEVMKMV
jgi:nitroreductase